MVVEVKFEDSKYNYFTSVNPKVSTEAVERYFVNKKFDVGTSTENFQKCIKVEIYNQ